MGRREGRRVRNRIGSGVGIKLGKRKKGFYDEALFYLQCNYIILRRSFEFFLFDKETYNFIPDCLGFHFVLVGIK